MNRILILLIALSFWACSDSNSESTANSGSEKEKSAISAPEPVPTAAKSCENETTFGDIKICLPEIEGMNECYSVPIVKRLADKFEYEGNSVLAFYLNDETYAQVDKLDQITYDDYFKIYATKQLQGVAAGKPEMEEVASGIEGSFLKEDWNDFKTEIEKSFDELSIGRPVLIEKYWPHEDALTFMVLTRYELEETSWVLVMTMNLVLVKDRLIWMAYYRNYDGEESVTETKTKNDKIILKLLAENAK